MNFPIVDLNPHVIDWIGNVPELGEFVEDGVLYGDLDGILSFDPDWDYMNRKGCIDRQGNKDKIYLFRKRVKVTYCG